MSDIKKYVEISDIPAGFNKSLNKESISQAYKKIYEYHSGTDGIIHPEKCVIQDPRGNRKEIPTISGTTRLNPLEIEQYIDIDKKVSNYDLDLMRDTLDIDLNSTWNDTLAGLKYDGEGSLRFFRSDFYTQISFSRILLLEAIENARKGTETMSFRDHYLRSSDLLFGDTDSISTGGSAGAIIIGENYASDTVLLIGKRSDKPSVNKNRYSIVPNSTVKYEQLKERGFEETVEHGIMDELMSYSGGIEKIAESVEVRDPYVGWNLRDCSLLAVYYLMIRDSNVYESVKDTLRKNREFQKIVEIPIKDYESISSLFNIENASPENIPAIARAVRLASRDDKMDNIEYMISTKSVM